MVGRCPSRLWATCRPASLVTGMFNVREVKIQTRGPDGGNSMPRRQWPCCRAPWLYGRDGNARRPAKDGLEKV